MAPKMPRPSLSEIAKEDSKLEVPESVKKEDKKSKPKPKPEKKIVKPKKVAKKKSEIIKNISEKETSTKAHFEKMSITVPPEMFEKLQDISRERRRAKEPFTMSDLVREALEKWLKKY